ncbi:MAG: hypothetical protein HY791_30830 [Deltaproteobacteria bacterium]|nr:hypothetical protein [Deltaproteobacteria bacterium]
MNDHPAIQPHHWDLIERTWPDRARLRAALDELPQDELASFAAHVIVARNLVRDRTNGSVGRGEPLSAMTIEDLTEWVVGHGRLFWTESVDADDRRLGLLFEEYLDESTPSLLGEAFASFGRFSGDLNDAVDAHLQRRA